MKENQHRDYSSFTASDFALDSYFVQWVKSENKEVSDFWVDWGARNPEKVRDLQAARVLVLAMNFDSSAFDQEGRDFMWNSLINPNDTRQPLQSRKNRKFRLALTHWFQLAAVVIFTVSVTFVAKEFGLIYNIGQGEYWIEVAAGKGQKSVVILPDGSKVKLNAESVLKYPEQFAKDKRSVVLTGEAYFQVQSSPDYPFIVQADQISATALGTSFNIRAYPDESELKVALSEGNLTIKDLKAIDAKNEYLLTPSDMLTLDKERRMGRLSTFDAETVFGWKDGILSFEKASFHQMINELERWYGVEFSVEESAEVNANWRFDGRFQKKSLSYILATLSYPDGFNYRIDDKQVVIY